MGTISEPTGSLMNSMSVQSLKAPVCVIDVTCRVALTQITYSSATTKRT